MEGFSVLTADDVSGNDDRAQHPIVAILDVLMPRMGGTTSAAHCARPGLRSTFVVLISSCLPAKPKDRARVTRTFPAQTADHDVLLQIKSVFEHRAGTFHASEAAHGSAGVAGAVPHLTPRTA
jgi:hypothetical protein